MSKMRLQLPLPSRCIDHIQQRIKDRTITDKDEEVILRWILKEPIVDSGDWFKRFNNFIIVGSGGVATSILGKNMEPHGVEIF